MPERNWDVPPLINDMGQLPPKGKGYIELRHLPHAYVERLAWQPREFSAAWTRSSASARGASLLCLGTHEAAFVDEPHDQQRRAQEEQRAHRREHGLASNEGGYDHDDGGERRNEVDEGSGDLAR